jgi:uncharacterized Zn-finger protein
VNVECKDTKTSVWRSQYNINVAIKLSEAYTNKMRIIARFSGLRRHNMNHQDKKKWECQICHKTFVEKDHFTGHVSVHHKIGQFACKKCHKEYAYKVSFTISVYTFTITKQNQQK